MTAFDAALTVIRLGDRIRLYGLIGWPVPPATLAAHAAASRDLDAALTPDTTAQKAA